MTAGLQGSVQQRYDAQFPGDSSIVGRLSIPLYEGGQTCSQIRQAKETVGQRRLDAEDTGSGPLGHRDGLGPARGLQGTGHRLPGAVQANEVALNGVREEARVGQRTTLDVLNAQQELLNARTNLIVAQRNRVIFSYGVVERSAA